MREGKHIWCATRPLVLCFSILLATKSSAQEWETLQLQTAARQCHFSIDNPGRLFANLDEQWREYKSEKELPDSTGDVLGEARVWRNAEGHTFLSLHVFSEDIANNSYYCFDTAGHLLRLHRETKTLWGWTYIKNVKRLLNNKYSEQSYFVEDQKERRIPKPQQAEEAKAWLDMEIHYTVEQLPFARQL